MEILTVKNLSFAYPDGKPVLSDVSFSLEEGGFLVLCGSSGSGKTTLLRQLKPPLAPKGTRGGEILFQGKPLSDLSSRAQAAEIAFVRQDPETGLVTDKVWHELAFGPESLGWPSETIRLRVAEVASFFGMEGWFRQDTSALSGGQKQLLQLASALVLSPKLLLLDEPTAQLDPLAAAAFLQAVDRVRRELGVSVLMSAHSLEGLLPIIDRLLVLEQGRLFAEGDPAAVGQALFQRKHPMFMAFPEAFRIGMALDSPVPLTTVGEGRNFVSDYFRGKQPKPFPPAPAADGTVVLSAAHLYFRYEKQGRDILQDTTLQLRQGEIYALIGGNGAGKTSLLKLLAGQAKPYSGKVEVRGKVGLLPQNPRLLFAGPALGAEISGEWAEKLGLDRLLDRHPYDLSGGEIQRAALAKLLGEDADILLLDEPTKGLDASAKKECAGILQRLAAAGKTILLVSHDLPFCAACANRVGLLFEGAVLAENSPRAFFSNQDFYTTETSRLARQVLPGAVLPEDITGCSFEPEAQTPLRQTLPLAAAEAPLPAPLQPQKRRRWPILLGLAAVTILIGLYGFQNRQYLLTSFLLLAYALIPPFLALEGRKPAASELTLLAVLTAIAVVSRTMAFMVPQVKPMLAVVILSGVALGGESGFLIGAAAAFLSNFFFGQGPWTPWQMFATGLVGFLAGQKWMSRKPFPLAIYGFLATLTLYGGLLDTGSLLIWQPRPTWEMLVTSLAMGVPFNLIHGISTAVCLLLFTRPMLQKLDRVLIKYEIDRRRI